MGKGDRKKPAKPVDLPKLAPVTRPKRRGRARQAELASIERGEKRQVLETRAKAFGISMHPETKPDGQHDSKAALRNKRVLTTMDASAMSSPAGRVIHLAKSGAEAASLLSCYVGLQNAEERYRRLVLGLSGHPKCGKVEFAPEVFATSADDDGPDLRDEDEKHRDAVNNWMRWRGYVGHLHAPQQSAIFDVLRERVEPHDQGKITTAGHRFITALMRLAEVVEAKEGRAA